MISDVGDESRVCVRDVFSEKSRIERFPKLTLIVHVKVDEIRFNRSKELDDAYMRFSTRELRLHEFLQKQVDVEDQPERIAVGVRFKLNASNRSDVRNSFLVNHTHHFDTWP